ncbi:glutathione S-transferase family protein [Saccharophagus degradans]|uniref:glutathione S-transferase family protein n=1 Tax=Saccharophagus degradans TaxID=86304 RepID=UPI002477D248|nr:glutathione S-transferase family protein [Saccharophagus degradans]WGO97756.1 glutathione S-transferase family protein [Saccharophagus degradans]
MNNIQIFGFPRSTYVQTVRLIALTLNLPITLAPLAFRQASHAELHPFMKMPAMKHGNITLFETLAIATYLNEQVPSRGLIPGKLEYKCRMLSWVSAAIDYYYPALVTAAVENTVDMDKCGNLLGILEKTLSVSPYLAGPELSLADLFILPMVTFIEKQAPCNGERPFKHLDNWLDTLKGKAGYMEILNDE